MESKINISAIKNFMNTAITPKQNTEIDSHKIRREQRNIFEFKREKE